MLVKANASRKFLMWLGLIALVCVAVCLWFLYDGTITYPRQRERALAYQALVEEDRLDEWPAMAEQRGWPLEAYPRQRERALAYQELVEENRLGEWPAIAEQRGWPLEDPGKPKTEAEILFQKVIAAMAVPPGLLYAFFFLQARGRWIEMNETGLRTSGGRRLEFDRITLLDKTKWRSKGIAKIKYQQNGKRRRLVLDDWKFDPEPIGEMLREVELHLDDDRIVGGLREPILEDKPADSEADGETEPA